MSVLIETTVGDLVVDLFYEERVEASQNFIKLCKMKYYNLNQFTTIQKDYIAQTGDPTNTGHGGESVYSFVHDKKCRFFPDNSKVKMKHKRKGTVSFVNCGQDMFGSQFLI
ncbi:UNVERIFIED_CONTAM: Peptidyl-prolyl cis-trans isomerase sig-7, partial [Eudyptes robustus]